MGAPYSKHAAATAARRTATLKLVTDLYLPGRVLVTCRIYDEVTRQYRTMPVSHVVPVRDFPEFQRLWRLLVKVVESDAWTDNSPIRRQGRARRPKGSSPKTISAAPTD